MHFTRPKFQKTLVDDGFQPADPHTKEVYQEVEAFARQGQPVVIFGPTGAGKEFLARHYYKILTETDFYSQWEAEWPANFNKIIEQYKPHYTDKEMKYFVSRLRPGAFQSINAATIYPNLAESILFGHDGGSFTDAKTKPGLLETIKYGVLFIDEIGELPMEVQAKLLLAVDSEIAIGRRIHGSFDYSLNDLIIISATNQPREKLRNDFYFKLGIDIDLKGIDDRPRDVLNLVPVFICNGIEKRKDTDKVFNMFGISTQGRKKKLSETKEVRQFAKEQSKLISDIILNRKWTGNLRALRVALEASIFRIESLDNKTTFADAFQKHFNYYVLKYSADPGEISLTGEGSSTYPIFPTKNPRLDNRIAEEFEKPGFFDDMDINGKKVLAIFISSTYKSTFKLPDLHEYFKRYPAVKNTSLTSLRKNVIKKLLDENILEKLSGGRGTRFQMTKSFTDMVFTKDTDIFSIPRLKVVGEGRVEESKELSKLLGSTERIYIQGPEGYGKSAFIVKYCHDHEDQRNFYYAELGEAGLNRLFKGIIASLEDHDIDSEFEDLNSNAIDIIQPHLLKLFKQKDGKKPVLVLDDVHYTADPEDKNRYVTMAKKWKEVILILLGDKMDDALFKDYFSFPLKAWRKK